METSNSVHPDYCTHIRVGTELNAERQWRRMGSCLDSLLESRVGTELNAERQWGPVVRWPVSRRTGGSVAGEAENRRQRPA